MSTLLNMIDDSLKWHLDHCEKPVGFFLSGGIDSTTLVMLATKYGPVNTFSSVFLNTSVDESKYLFAAIKALPTGGNASILTPPSPTPDDMKTLEQIHGGPVPPSVYVQWKVLGMAKEKGMKTMIDGQGPDEMFGGYLFYQAVYVKTLLHRKQYLTAIRELLGSLYYHPMFWMQSLHKHLKGQTTEYDVKLDIPIEQLMDGDLLAYSLPKELEWLHDNAAYWGITVRSPYVNADIQSYALKLPVDQKIRNGVSKWCLRQAIKGVVPEVIRNRQSKLGFPAPKEWKQ